MNRINLFCGTEVRGTDVRNTAVRNTPSTRDSITWGKTNFETTTSTLVFAALLIVCSIGVGCSSDKPKSVSSNNPSAMTPPVLPAASPTPAPALQAAAKPVHKKIVHKAPVMLAYADKTTGVSFQYPRKYELKTGDSADELVSSDAVPMDFVQPGGIAVAAVAVPETAYPKSDLATAFFNVSVNKSLTAEQCGEFSAPQATATAPADTTTSANAAVPAVTQPSKLMIGDMELQSAETLASNGTREEASKYYHVFENGGCYEFALKVATTGVETEGGKHVDREEVFKGLEKILATVKINSTAEVTASAPAAVAPATPAQ
jgi:hypothetical protein